MKKITLNLSNNKKITECPIIIGDHLVKKITRLFDLTRYSHIFIVTDTNIERLHLSTFLSAPPKKSSVIVLPQGEKEKNINTVQKILRAMHKAHCDRNSLVINLGGGVISDIGGFAASIYMRGIDVLNIPTTLLAQVDAGIGGKTGINLLGLKNLIGTFAQPIGVIIDVAMLPTLPDRELISGFGEIIKHGLIADSLLFRLATSKKPREFTRDELITIITRSCQIKADIVALDQTEQNVRKLLNFGHTVGHAIEALNLTSKHPLTHGEAVILGMLVETRISQLIGILSTDSCVIIEQTLSTLLSSRLSDTITIPTILKTIQSDKKSNDGHVQWTLLREIGKAVVNQEVDDNVVIQALRQMKGTLV